MALTGRPPIAVADASQVGVARRAARDLAAELGFAEADDARVALVATELATNLVKHGGGGEILVQAGGGGLELIALDRGPGIADVAGALRDGMSTAGTAGNGLGAVTRVATRFDLHSVRGHGTAIYAAVTPAGPLRASSFEIGAIRVPYPGEHECGDGYAAVDRDGRAVVLVVDGLGHGHLAAAAADRAAEMFAAHQALAPAELMRRLHEGLRPTRGAAAAIAEVDARRGVVRYCGVGNIAATLLVDGATRSLVSHHGTLGHDARRIAEFEYPWASNALLVFNSDGLVSNWTMTGHPGLAGRAASLVAAVLYRDFRRLRDDTTVVVLRGTS